MLKAAVLAGGEWQYNLVKYLRTRGYFVYCVNPVVSPTTLLADQHIVCDVKDEEKVYHALKGLGLTLLVSDQSEVTPLPVARLNRQLGLPGNPPETIRRFFINKYLMMVHAKEIGTPCPKTRAVWSLDDFSDCEYPLVIKPVESHSSRGFSLVKTKEALEDAWNEAVKFSQVAITQEVVPGTEVTLEGFCCAGHHQTLAVSKKTHFRAGIASSLTYPCDLPEDLMAKVVEANDRYVESTDMSFAITHSEYMVDVATGRFWLIEIAARGGGSNISSVITPWVSGVDVYSLLHDCSVGKKLTIPKPLRRPAILKFYEFPEGMPVGDMSVVGDIKAIANVQDFRFNFTASQYLYPANSDNTRHATLIVLADTNEEMAKAVSSVNEILTSRGWQI